jgi:uncharacterized protein (DUF924 family)/glutathione S-transferase
MSLDPTTSPDDVLIFWFGAAADGDKNTVVYLQNGWKRWFMGQDLLFDLVQHSSKELIARAAGQGPLPAGPLGLEWTTSRGKLARILLLDQFTRVAFRGTAQAFAHDELACDLARSLASEGFDELLPVERFFVALALSHAENLQDSKLHVDLAVRLCSSLPAGHEVRDYFAKLTGFPHEHFETIERFARFPHRNALLGRSSTAAEEAWLLSPSCPGWAKSQKRACLTYWNGRGLGDVIRFLLEFCLIPFDEVNVLDSDAFAALKASGKLAFGQVPLLEIDGLELVQTQAILRYVAGKKQLRGTTAADEARADMMVNGVLDARMQLITARFQADPTAALAKFETATLPKLAGHLEALLKTHSHSGEYLCAGGLTYADVVLLETLCYAADECTANLESILAPISPRVLAHYQRMRAFKHVGAYLQSERRKPTPDVAFVRRTCAILGMPAPEYARDGAKPTAPPMMGRLLLSLVLIAVASVALVAPRAARTARA